MSGGGGGGGTQVLKPEPWIGDQRVSFGDPSTGLAGLYGAAGQLYKRGPAPVYQGKRVAGLSPYDQRAIGSIGFSDPYMQHAWTEALAQAKKIGRTPITDQGAYSTAIGGIPQYLGGDFGLTNTGDWQNTVYQQGRGDINPYLGQLAGAIQNQAFSDYDRALLASQGAGAQGINQALGGFNRAAEGALGSYQRAVQPTLSNLQDQLSTANRDFTEQVLPQIRGAASGAGGYGGSRQGIAEGIASRGQIESLNRAIGRAGEGFGLAAGQLGQGLALGAGDLGQQLLGSAQERQRQAYLGGQQAAEAAAGQLANLYGGAFENAQGRALQAAGIGLQGDIANQNILQQNKQTDINALTNLGQLGNQRFGTSGNIALGGLQGLSIAPQIAAQKAGLLGQAGQLQRGIQQAQLDAARQKFNEPYLNRLNQVQNYITQMSASRPPIPGTPTVIPSGTSQVGSFLGGGLSGAGTGALIGSMVPGIGTLAGTIGGGLIGGLGGLF